MMLSTAIETFQESGFGDPASSLDDDEDDEDGLDQLQNLPSTDTSDDDVNPTDMDDEEYSHMLTLS